MTGNSKALSISAAEWTMLLVRALRGSLVGVAVHKPPAPTLVAQGEELAASAL